LRKFVAVDIPGAEYVRGFSEAPSAPRIVWGDRIKLTTFSKTADKIRRHRLDSAVREMSMSTQLNRDVL
jgi:hypothetical protein